MYAWFEFAGSTEMLLIGRPGEFAASVSSLVNVTALAGSASAFFEMKTRPRGVAAQRVELSLVARLTQLIWPPARVPRELVVSDRPSSVTQSPHCTVKSPVNSLQCWSKYACGPPSSFVRHTWLRPQYIVPCTVGSVMIGK